MMLKHCLQSLTKNYKLFLIRECSTASHQKWDLLAAVCIERKPVITPLLNDLQKDFSKHLAALEYERSCKSDHEVRHERDLKQAELLKKGDVDVDLALKQTAQDFVDSNLEELKKFKFSDRITDADKSNDLLSLSRKLDKHLVLVTKQNLGDRSFYLLPQGPRRDGETLRQTADRIVKESFGEDLKVKIFGNAPSGVYKYKYPKEIGQRNGTVGAKIFFYFARYGRGSLPEKNMDYRWLDRTELKQELLTEYHNSVAQFLIDEN